MKDYKYFKMNQLIRKKAKEQGYTKIKIKNGLIIYKEKNGIPEEVKNENKTY